MANFWFHPEEESTIGVLEGFLFNGNRNQSLRFDFADGESFWCTYVTSYETDNEYEIDEGIETEENDFHAVAVEPQSVIVPGKRTSAGFELIQIDYRDFPVLITTESGEVVYNKPNA